MRNTSEEARLSINEELLEARVLKIIQKAGRLGIISDEIRATYYKTHGPAAYSSITARYAALKRKKLIAYKGDRVRPGISGRNQHVLIAAKYQ